MMTTTCGTPMYMGMSAHFFRTTYLKPDQLDFVISSFSLTSPLDTILNCHHGKKVKVRHVMMINSIQKLHNFSLHPNLKESKMAGILILHYVRLSDIELMVIYRHTYGGEWSKTVTFFMYFLQKIRIEVRYVLKYK